MLEARELVLRRRFETIIEELTDTRNLLAGVPVTKAEQDQRQDSGGRRRRAVAPKTRRLRPPARRRRRQNWCRLNGSSRTWSEPGTRRWTWPRRSTRFARR